MCQSGSRITFCACTPDEPLPCPRWELWRSRPDRDMLERFTVGEIVRPSREDDAMHFRFHDKTWLGSWGAGFGSPTQTAPAAAGRIERHRRQDFETSDW